MSFRATLLKYLYETYTRARIEQLFNIIIEFPDSQPALEDLRYSTYCSFLKIASLYLGKDSAPKPLL
jgi:hypothetical protein